MSEESPKPIESKGEIAAALAKAQAKMKNPAFDKKNPHFGSPYASLAAVRDAVIPALASEGICLVQDVTADELGVACRTMLIHSSGQSMTFSPLHLPVSKRDAQGCGSAITYARRYSLMAVAGVVGDEDDDGNAAAHAAPPAQRKVADAPAKTKKDAKVEKTPRQQLVALAAEFAATGKAEDGPRYAGQAVKLVFPKAGEAGIKEDNDRISVCVFLGLALKVKAWANTGDLALCADYIKDIASRMLEMKKANHLYLSDEDADAIASYMETETFEEYQARGK